MAGRSTHPHPRGRRHRPRAFRCDDAGRQRRAGDPRPASGTRFRRPTCSAARDALSISTSSRSKASRRCARWRGTRTGLIEGFRPGTMERLGIGPAALLESNPRLVFGRMTGWGQTGPLAKAAGHDINYIALSGALHAIGRPGSNPAPPLALVGDFGGRRHVPRLRDDGGAVARAAHRQGPGRRLRDGGRCEPFDVRLLRPSRGRRMAGRARPQRSRRAAHFYDTYETAVGQHVAIGAIEPQFYREILKRLDIDDPAFDPQMDRTAWPALKQKLAAVFRPRRATNGACCWKAPTPASRRC